MDRPPGLQDSLRTKSTVDRKAHLIRQGRIRAAPANMRTGCVRTLAVAELFARTAALAILIAQISPLVIVDPHHRGNRREHSAFTELVLPSGLGGRDRFRPGRAGGSDLHSHRTPYYEGHVSPLLFSSGEFRRASRCGGSLSGPQVPDMGHSFPLPRPRTHRSLNRNFVRSLFLYSIPQR